MLLRNCIWLPDVVDKLASKHSLSINEVEEVLFSKPRVFRVEEGYREAEDLYAAYGRTDAGRLLVVFFILKSGGSALVISARDMSPRERQRYGRK